MRKKPPKILIIDDEKDLLESLKLVLELNGFSVTLCLSAEQAFRAIEQAHYDLVLTDIEMPVKSGMDLIATLKEGMDINIPIVIMTGRVSIEYLMQAIKIGATDFICKPIHSANLIELINRHIVKSKVNTGNFDLNHSIVSLYKKYIFYPEDYFHSSISHFLQAEIKKNIPLPPQKINNVCLILEEAIANAFLHGIWQLTPDDRHLERATIIKLTDKINLERKEARTLAYITVEIDYDTEAFRLTITDTGSGFDYHKYMEKEDFAIDHCSFSGRGLFLIKALADAVLFHNGGSKIEIVINA